MGFSEYSSFDGVGLAELVRKREVTPTELVDAAIEARTDANATLNAVVREGFDYARRDAAGTLPDGRRGVPFLVKDLYTPVGGLADVERLALVRPPHQRGRRRARAPLPLERHGAARQEQHAGVRHHRHHRERVPGTVPQPVESEAHRGRLERRGGGVRGRGGDRADGARVSMAGSIASRPACCGLVGLKTTRDRNPICLPEAGGIMFSVNHIVSRHVHGSAAMLDWTGRPVRRRTSRRPRRTVCTSRT